VGNYFLDIKYLHGCRSKGFLEIKVLDVMHNM